MHPSKTQACVICTELENIAEMVKFGRRFVFSMFVNLKPDDKSKADKDLENHKTICNVSEVWIGGRGYEG